MPDTPKTSDALLYPRIMRAVQETPWAILPEMHAVIMDLLAFRSDGGRLTKDEIRARIGAASGAQVGAARSGAVAVLPLHGVIVNRADMFDEVSGAASLDRFRTRFREALADDSVGSILLHVDSPGGAVDGVPETADEILSARGKKPIVAIADTVAASAAYWIATAADELVVTPSGEAGSIGVYSAHTDMSERYKANGVKMTLLHYGENKVLGNPFEPLTDAAREAIQSRVDDYGRMFDAAVAKARGVKVSDVRERFGQGLVFGAKDAVARGMADRVATFEDTVARLRGTRRQARPAARRNAFAFI